MSSVKQSLRAAVDRLLLPYFDRLYDRVSGSASAGLSSLAAGLEGVVNARAESVSSEVRSEVAQVTSEVRSEVRSAVDGGAASVRSALEPRLDALELRMMTFESLQNDYEGWRTRDQTATTHALEALSRGAPELRASLEPRLDALELRLMTFESLQNDYEGLRSRDMASVRKEAASLRQDVRRDIVELTRMLRMQGDSADQVAEALGRTIARLSAEVEALSGFIDGLRLAPEGAPAPA